MAKATGSTSAAQTRQPTINATELQQLVDGQHSDPHRLLGVHGTTVRSFRPDAHGMSLVLPDGATVAMARIHEAGVFEGELPSPEMADTYRLCADYGSGPGFVFDDPYKAWPTLGEMDLHLLGEGRHRALWRVLGAHHRCHQGVDGTSFAVWAPNAQSVRVVGDWNYWDGRVQPMRSLGSSGVWELFVPGVEAGARYKFEMIASDGRRILKADPFAFATEVPPGTASIVADEPSHAWNDDAWMQARADNDHLATPMSVYEMHIGSWRHKQNAHGDWVPLTYREMADELPDYLAELGFTHVEFMPVAEHPFGGSWGYQVSAYYAPSSRFGNAEDLRYLIDVLHQRGIGVIIDWVPAHFPRDDFALAQFDGTALYEHADPRQGSHPDWGTLVFNFGRNEVRNFLIANALFWLQEFHVDGLRVDAVASMLYLDYSRKAGEWVPNQFGGRENLEAVSFLKEMNETVYGEVPGVMTIAEESTAWPAVSKPTYVGGLGFGFKWNMGWMHDTLEYFQQDPVYRRYHQNSLTFGLVYAWSENFVLPLSHDEVVHGKGSMINKMPGDRWQQMANLRALYAWMWAHPGKQLIFMGGEIAQDREWSHDRSLDWHLLEHDTHRGVRSLVAALNEQYRALPALYTRDFAPDGFRWIDASDADNNVLSFLRISADGSQQLACIANLSPVPHEGYRVGLPVGGPWTEVLNTDATEYAGSGMGNSGGVWADEEQWHGLPHSALVTLPPLAVLWLVPE